MSSTGHRVGPDVLSVAVLAALPVVLYHDVVRLWWTHDDPWALRAVASSSFLAPFKGGGIRPQQLFTPLTYVAFEVEWGVFGLSPVRWYAAQLAITIATTLAVYTAVRQFLSAPYSLAAAAMFAAGAPICGIVTQLSTVHYLIATFTAALATIAYVHALRRSSIALTVVSAFLYLAALLAKEIAITLPFFLLILPERDLRTRARFALGHGVTCVLYFAWRYIALGTFFGAYGWYIAPAEYPRLLLVVPWRVLRVVDGIHLGLGVALIGSVAAALAPTIRSLRRLGLLMMGVLAVIGPILPLANQLERRYVIVPWLALSVVFVASVVRLPDRRLRTATLVVVPLLTIAMNRPVWNREYSVRHRMSDEAHSWYAMSDTSLLRNPSPPASTLSDLTWLKAVSRGQPAASWFSDDYYLCAHTIDLSGLTVWEYESRRRTMVDISAKVPGLTRSHCGGIRDDVPLTVKLHSRHSALHWDLGPYEEGRYVAVLADGQDAFRIARRDALNLPTFTSFRLRIRYDSPEGWTTYSPELIVDSAVDQNVVWSR